MRRVQIEEFIAGSKGALLLDVRSPSEYNHAHIPGAISFPLFTDEERKVVGTAYKQESRETAIKIGLDYFGPKMRGMVEKVEQLIVDSWPSPEGTTINDQQSTVNIFLYCWRGGMRSGAVSWLLNMYGFNVTVLAGGYKAFRNWALQTIDYPYRLCLIGGYTGSGKTAILKEMEQRGEPVVNLEELANHKGSAFGNIGMPQQPTQEMFENVLSIKMNEQYVRAKSFTTTLEIEKRFIKWPQKPILIEDESQRIGLINIPQSLWQNMRRSPLYFFDIPFEERLENLVTEYGSLNTKELSDAIIRIKKRLGPLETKTALQYLEEQNKKECFRILLHYYDKHYLKGLQNRQNLDALLTNISCETVTPHNASLISQVQVTQ